MENSSTIRWLSELQEMEDQTAFIHQYDHMNSHDDQLTAQQIAAVLGIDFTRNSFSSSESLSPYMEAITERPTKQLKTSDSWNSCTTTDYHSQHKSTTHEASSSSPTNLLSFGSNDSSTINPHQTHLYASTLNLKEEAVSPGNSSFLSDVLISHHEGSYMMNKNSVSKGNPVNKRATTTATTKLSSYNQDHVMAERKRREKLSQRFIALSAIVPGLKKMDKASVLGDAIKYLKQLQEQVNTLEEQKSKKTMESVVFVKKTQLLSDDDTSSSDENSSGCSDEPLPEIEARVSNKNVLIRIHCERRKGVLVKTLSEIEKLNLSILNSSAIPFGDSALDITVTAQMDSDYSMTLKDLVKNLRSAFRQFM